MERVAEWISQCGAPFSKNLIRVRNVVNVFVVSYTHWAASAIVSSLFSLSNMSSKIEYQVPSLNVSITGEVEGGVVCFRGIPYATLDKRWTHSQTKHSLESPFDATKYGARCPQGDGLVLVTGGVNDPTPGDDEFNCLNLNVAVPHEALNRSAGLPVMVWIHGYASSFLILVVDVSSLLI